MKIVGQSGQTIEPDKEAVLRVRLRVGSKSLKDYRKTFRVDTNDPLAPVLNLTILKKAAEQKPNTSS
ncbi:MAG: hypothetical protein N2C12_07215 [Planctomycetales bacterium]